MKIYICKSAATDKKYCFVSRHLSPLSLPISHGLPIGPVLERVGAARVEFDLDEDRGGLTLPDMVGNRLNYLIFSNSAVESIAPQIRLGPHDVVPAALINKKKRLHSEAYTVVNPHGRIGCLDPKGSELEDDGDGQIFVKMFGKYALESRSIPENRDIFRVKGLAVGYMFTERLVALIKSHELTNVEFSEVPVT